MSQAQGAIAQGIQPPRWGDPIVSLSEERLAQLGQVERLGSDLSFVDGVPRLRVIRELLTALSYQDPVWEPRDLAAQVSQHLDELLRDVGTMEAFTPTDNPAVRRDNLLLSIDQHRSWFVEHVGPVIRSAEVQGANALADAIAKRDEIQAAADEAKAALITIREAAGEKGTADLARFFEGQAASHKVSSETMLKSGIGSVAALLVVGAVFVFYEPMTIKPTADLVDYLRQLVPRLFLLGIIGYTVRFFARNYTVNKHLQVSNEQRATILRSYPAMIAAGQTEVQKDRMAVVFATAAVADIDSGYLKHAEDKGVDSALLTAVELARR